MESVVVQVASEGVSGVAGYQRWWKIIVRLSLWTRNVRYMSVLVYGIRNHWLWPLTVAPGGIMKEVPTARWSFIIQNIIMTPPASLFM